MARVAPCRLFASVQNSKLTGSDQSHGMLGTDGDQLNHQPAVFSYLCLNQHSNFVSCLFCPIGISVSISTFSLVAIAIERYSAICNPLKSRSWQTRSHAYRVIAATWVVSLLIMVPYPVFSALKTFPKTNGTVGHMCRLDWPSREAEQTW